MNKQLEFSEWASLMDRVYTTNDNGKWALLYAITCAMRDFIFENRRYFTALFFIGPTSSGKSQIAESIRNLFMDVNTPAFNLNTGTDAAFFMLLESLRNIPVVMEEYNDNSISPIKFQGLKSATLDGEGKIKVKDASAKTMDSSEINASIVILGQEAAQQDDGALSNRCIMCDVPYRATGDFTDEETAIYERLKGFEKTGLSNILLQVLQLRPLFEKYYLQILIDETKEIKNNVKVNVTVTEGLTRILNAVALMSATCKLIELHAPELKLPFTAAEFQEIGSAKILSQLEKISSTNKLTTYFQTISTLITHGKLLIGRDIKISEPKEMVTVLLAGKRTQEIKLDVGTKVLYIDFEAVYSLYQFAVKDQSLSRQSLKAYFESNQAYIGLCKSTRFKWQVAEFGAGVEAVAVGDEIKTNSIAKHLMSEKTKSPSAYMFNYNILKVLLDIDFERSDESETPTTKVSEFKEPESQDLPF